MPTPPRAFIDMAVRYGEVDPDDEEAVIRFFTDVLPTLPSETIDEILAYLLSQECVPAEGAELTSYPDQAPDLELDDAPPAGLPASASRWRHVVAWMARRRRRS